MKPEGASKKIQRDTARRYCQWVTERMKAEGWDQATLARRSGLPKQTVSVIVGGTAAQPTLWQIAALARAFRVPPNEIFQAVGAWETGEATPGPVELGRAYLDLGFPGRRALLGASRVIREMQDEYSAILRPDEEEAEPQEPPSLHPRGTMPHLYPPAADTGEDLSRPDDD